MGAPIADSDINLHDYSLRVAARVVPTAYQESAADPLRQLRERSLENKLAS